MKGRFPCRERWRHSPASLPWCWFSAFNRKHDAASAAGPGRISIRTGEIDRCWGPPGFTFGVSGMLAAITPVLSASILAGAAAVLLQTNFLLHPGVFSRKSHGSIRWPG